MSDFVPWSHDSKTGISKSVRLEGNGDITVKRSQDVSALVEANKAVQNSGVSGYNQDRSRRHVAHIPEIVRLDILANEGIDIYKPEGEERLFKLLTDSNFAALRTNDSKLGLSNGQIR